MFPTVRNVKNNEILEMGVNLRHGVFWVKTLNQFRKQRN